MVQNGRLALTLLAWSQVCAVAARPCRAEETTGAIHVNVGYVEVCVTVKDGHGRYVGGLSQDSFRVYDNGQPQEIASFQNFNGELACAIVLDTTGSMYRAMPALKNAVMQLIDRFRPEDLFGLYSFDSSVRLVQQFTQDKGTAKRAVLRLQPRGATALFDAISQVARGLEERKGKVAVVVFTDGSDNASALSIGSAVDRVKRLGMPLYTVAQGEALRDRRLLDELRLLATTTGGLSYAIKRSRDVEQVFSDISRDLQNTYMLAYNAPPAGASAWRTIQVSIPALKDITIRTKQGYLPR